jgi:RNA polymerase subunit RPABC4/transcription elongation factor Spt4
VGEILSELLTPQVQFAIALIVVAIVALYLISIVWVIRDAYLRGVSPVKWGIVALIPFFGAFAYSILRPPLLIVDRDEQELDFLLKQRELMNYGECGRCGYPVEKDYIMCPRCSAHLKTVCQNCGKPMNADWTVCPYCATKLLRGQSSSKGGQNASGQRPKSSAKDASDASTQRSKTSAKSAPKAPPQRSKASTKDAPKAPSHRPKVSTKDAPSAPAHRPKTTSDRKK